MHQFLFGNLLLLGSMLTGAAGHALLKRLMTTVTGPIFQGSMEIATRPAGQLHLAIVLALLITAFFLWALSLRYLPLTYAYAVSSTTVVVVALISKFFLAETIPFQGWIGVILIAGGIILVIAAAGPDTVTR